MAGQHAGRTEGKHAGRVEYGREGHELARYRSEINGIDVAHAPGWLASDPERIGAIGPVSGDDLALMLRG